MFSYISLIVNAFPENYFLPYLNVQENVQRSVAGMCLHVLISSCVIYLVCWGRCKIYDILTRLFCDALLSKVKSVEF